MALTPSKTNEGVGGGLCMSQPADAHSALLVPPELVEFPFLAWKRLDHAVLALVSTVSGVGGVLATGGVVRPRSWLVKTRPQLGKECHGRAGE